MGEHLEDFEGLRQEVRARLDLPPPHARKAIRRAAGASRSRVARGVGVSESAIGYYERGLRTPRNEHLLRYAAVLAVLREEAIR